MINRVLSRSSNNDITNTTLVHSYLLSVQLPTLVYSNQSNKKYNYSASATYRQISRVS